MCGITGVIQFNGKVDPQIVQAMTPTITHRGPDAEGYLHFEHASFGHRRLAVIDIENGKQPMTKQIGETTYAIVYNGELYNTDQLRNELISIGHHFTTTSDTEVVLTSYIAWGEKCVERMNGIFAFGIWNSSQEKLFLCRDRLGVKPLFYVQIGDGIVFASEIKALLQHPKVKSEITFETFASLLSIGPSRPLGQTVFKNIKELLPGHCMTIARNHQYTKAYWELKDQPHTMTEEETIDHVRLLLKDAVARQLVSDVPLCTFLSGGLDSSIISALASQTYEQQGQKLHTFSVEYEENEKFFKTNAFQHSQDRDFIEYMKKEFPIEHTEIIISQQQLAEHLYTALTLKDYPSMVDIDSSLYLFCNEVRKDFTVALSGECADEIFGGYPWFNQPFNSFPWIRDIDQRESFLQPYWRGQLDLKSSVNTIYEQAISNFKVDNTAPVSDQEHKKLSHLNFMYFMQTLLERKDRMSMGVGLEVRVPFADHRIVEFVWNIPAEMKRFGGREKGLLREAMKYDIPQEIYTRKKTPYPKTQHPLYAKLVSDMLSEALSDQDSILHSFFEESKLNALIRSQGAIMTQPWFGQLLAGPQYMAFLVQLHEWFKRYNIQVVS